MTSDVIFSQYNGSSIPLSNIVESGDGYIRYSDGTQICYGTFGIGNRTYSPNGYARYDLIYPKTFDALPAAGFANIDNVQPTSLSTKVKANFSIMSCGGSSSDLFIYVYNGNSESVKAYVYLNYIAIGRWK